ncbi:hypothetical protein ACFU99_16210 [Streptomyces sp. NPDC057654]|uniref:hypothetical protein n=1 Tax=Streptomyces sp. NPDC057654 TaxID=3346196 RepID=UPI00367EB573
MGLVAGPEAGAQAARGRALAVLRIRSAALTVALLPAAVAVVLLAGSAMGRIGDSWDAVRWTVVGVAAVVLVLAAGVAAVVVRARPACSPTVPVPEETAPDLYRLVRDLADRLDVPAPSAIALTPDCDSWLEDRTHPAHGARRRRSGRSGQGGQGGAEARQAEAPVLVVGSPFLWWMRVAELRALLAPVVAGTGPAANADIAAARRFVRGLDAAVAVGAGGASGRAGESRGPAGAAAAAFAPLLAVVRRPALAFVGWVARLLLRSCRVHAAEMERCVAAAASERAQGVDYGLRIVAQEQVGLAYAGWDRLLTRVALPAWRMGRWPSRLDAGVVAALTELSRRDRLADGFTTRLGERPACDLLEEPGLIDEATSLLAARLFHGGLPEPGPDWSPVAWSQYPEEVVDRKWRQEAARLHRALDDVSPAAGLSPSDAAGVADAAQSGTDARTDARTEARTPARSETSARVRTEARTPARTPARTDGPAAAADGGPVGRTDGMGGGADRDGGAADAGPPAAPTLARVIARLTSADGGADVGDGLASWLTAEVAREEAAQQEAAQREAGRGDRVADDPWLDGLAPPFPLQPPRTGRELLTDHVTAMVCCAAMDSAGAAPGLDWLDGPALLFGGARRSDLAGPVLSLVEDGDDGPLRVWLGEVGVRPEKPVRLV